MTELLAPAGSWESMVAAVRTGADAVYLGAGQFNARRHAQNFSIQDTSDATPSLAQAVAFCHARDVKVYLTLNTLVRDRELPDALHLAKSACECGVDALILQDRGLARVLRQYAPQMPLHASTQLSCHTPAGVRQLRDLGFQRVVLAREMTKDEIAQCTELGCELEVFVHGALCMSVSGQCEFSAMLGSRSGNRGLCAQPCRLPFAVGHRPAEDEAVLSLKDNSLYDHVPTLQEMGIASLKIEGRMKRPEYVAAATAVLRDLLDGKKPDEQVKADLRAVFSRSGFTDGYFTGVRDGDMFGSRRAEDIAPQAVLNRLAQLYTRERQSVPVTLSLKANPLTLTATDEKGHTVTVADPYTPTMDNALDSDRLAMQLQKTGGTPFTATATAEPAAVPLSAVNALRRRALEALYEKRTAPTAIPFTETPLSKPAFSDSILSGLVARVESVTQINGEADAWIVPLGKTPNVPYWGVEIPRGIFGREETVRKQLQRAAKAGAAFALCNTVGAIPLCKEAGLRPVAGPFYHITNAESLAAAVEDGAEAAILSFELTFPQMQFAGSRCGIFAYGRQPLMLFRNCPVSASVGCLSCGGNSVVVDRRGTEFPIRCAGECSELLNAVPLYLADRLAQLPPHAFLYLHFTDEAPARVLRVLDQYRNGGKPPAHYTRGLYKRGVL